MKSLVGKVKVSYCAVHNTYPEDGEPCWGCANPFIESAYQAGLKKAAQQSVQRMGLLVRIKKWFGAIAHR